MKKKLFIVILLGLFLLGVTGCGDKLSEEDLIGTSWEYIFEDGPSVSNCYGFKFEFLEANMVKFSRLYVSGSKTTIEYTYELEEEYIAIYEKKGELENKYKFNEDKTTLTSIDGETVYKKVD